MVDLNQEAANCELFELGSNMSQGYVANCKPPPIIAHEDIPHEDMALLTPAPKSPHSANGYSANGNNGNNGKTLIDADGKLARERLETNGKLNGIQSHLPKDDEAWQKYQARKERKKNKRGQEGISKDALLSNVPEIQLEIKFRVTVIIVGEDAHLIAKAICESEEAGMLEGIVEKPTQEASFESLPSGSKEGGTPTPPDSRPESRTNSASELLASELLNDGSQVFDQALDMFLDSEGSSLLDENPTPPTFRTPGRHSMSFPVSEAGEDGQQQPGQTLRTLSVGSSNPHLDMKADLKTKENVPPGDPFRDPFSPPPRGCQLNFPPRETASPTEFKIPRQIASSTSVASLSRTSNRCLVKVEHEGQTALARLAIKPISSFLDPVPHMQSQAEAESSALLFVIEPTPDKKAEAKSFKNLKRVLQEFTARSKYLPYRKMLVLSTGSSHKNQEPEPPRSREFQDFLESFKIDNDKIDYSVVRAAPLYLHAGRFHDVLSEVALGVIKKEQASCRAGFDPMDAGAKKRGSTVKESLTNGLSSLKKRFSKTNL